MKQLTNNINKEKSIARGKIKAKPNFHTCSSNKKNYQLNVILTKHATEIFQLLLTTESIYFCPSKLNPTQKDLHKSTQQQAMNILQWTTHEMSKPLRIFHNF